jgi:hypothetical protein
MRCRALWQFPETKSPPNLKFYPNRIPIGSHVADRERATRGPQTAGVAMSVNPRSCGGPAEEDGPPDFGAGGLLGPVMFTDAALDAAMGFGQPAGNWPPAHPHPSRGKVATCRPRSNVQAAETLQSLRVQEGGRGARAVYDTVDRADLDTAPRPPPATCPGAAAARVPGAARAPGALWIQLGLALRCVFFGLGLFVSGNCHKFLVNSRETAGGAAQVLGPAELGLAGAHRGGLMAVNRISFSKNRLWSLALPGHLFEAQIHRLVAFATIWSQFRTTA